MRKFLFLALICTGLATGVSANDNEDSLQAARLIDSIENSLQYKTGIISLGNGIATIKVPDGYKFLDGEQARFVVEDLWGNLKNDKAPLGMLFPDSSTATNPTYAFLVQFEEIGYVKDNDANKINYDDLLDEIRKDQVEANKQRVALQMEQMFVVGWAAKPFYDSKEKILHWAKEFRVEGEEENTLNYDVLFLGRKGILKLEAISGMSQLPNVNTSIPSVLDMISFTEGNRYADFDSKTDNVAAWTIGGLVAGKLLAKAGFFALLLKNIKLVLLGLAALGAGIWRFIRSRRKKTEEEFVYAPAQPEQDTPPSIQ